MDLACRSGERLTGESDRRPSPGPTCFFSFLCTSVCSFVRPHPTPASHSPPGRGRRCPVSPDQGDGGLPAQPGPWGCRQGPWCTGHLCWWSWQPCTGPPGALPAPPCPHCASVLSTCGHRQSSASTLLLVGAVRLGRLCPHPSFPCHSPCLPSLEGSCSVLPSLPHCQSNHRGGAR